ncbi:MAG: heat-inducible transcriptional repressor [Gaiellales bacterium]|jgi:heat-inducible transcriptional repressor|nr:heat-inducible transcriptional repressor [Gaiellales bacterium]
MLDDRKAAILQAVVQEYIETAQPVGSNRVARQHGLNVSPATVRNEMSVLEREGYLAQPHTSAGRIPTDKGYRFFVDQLTDVGALPSVKRQQVKAFFAHAHGELEQMLLDTSRLLSSLTDCAAVVVGPQHEGGAVVRSVHLVDLGGRAAVAVVVFNNGTVEKHMIELDPDDGAELVAAASAHLNAHLVDRTLASAETILASGDQRLDRLTKAVVAAIASIDTDEGEHVFVGGASRMAAAFDAVDTVRSVLSTLEQQYVIVTLLREVLDGSLSVSIGAELGLEQLAECALVVAPYAIEGETAGTIGVLGPTRMNYPDAMAAVAIVSRRLGSRLSEG